MKKYEEPRIISTKDRQMEVVERFFSYDSRYVYRSDRNWRLAKEKAVITEFASIYGREPVGDELDKFRMALEEEIIVPL